MKLYSFLGLLVSALLALVSFYATSNIFIGGGVLLVSLLLYFLLFQKSLLKYSITVTKLHECYLFVNNYLITLSIKESLNAAFESTSNAISPEFKEFSESVEDLNPQEKLHYLQKYFPFQIYRLFVDVINLWTEQGGNILQMSSQITNDIREIEEYTTYSQSINRRKALEIGVLWLFSLIIIIVLKIALQDFYSDLLTHPIFIGSVIALMVVVLFSLYILMRKITYLDVRGIEDGQ